MAIINALNLNVLAVTNSDYLREPTATRLISFLFVILVASEIKFSERRQKNTRIYTYPRTRIVSLYWCKAISTSAISRG